MPLTNNVIIKLNEITMFVEDKSNLKDSEIEEIKSIFKILCGTQRTPRFFDFI